MGIQKLIDFPGIDILAPADDHILAASGDFAISIIIHYGQIARMQRALGVNGVFGFLGHFIVAFHDMVPARAELALHTGGQGNGTIAEIHDFYLNIGQRTANRAYPQVQRIIGNGFG